MTTATTTPPLTIVCSEASHITMTVMLAAVSVSQITSGQQGVDLPQQLILRDTIRVMLALLICHSNNDLSPRCLLSIFQLCHWSSAVKFLFQGWASQWFMSCVGVCYSVCFMLSGPMWLSCSPNGGLNHWVFYHCNLLKFTLGRHIYLMVIVCGPHQECTKWLFFPLPQVAGIMLLTKLSPSHMMGHSTFGA